MTKADEPVWFDYEQATAADFGIPVSSGPTPPTNIAEVARLGIRGGALTNIAITPHSKKSHTISDLVQAVVIASAVKIAHSSQSIPTCPRTSLIALRTMIAITAAPIP